jgi:3-oxoacyl-[acyl-carrier protein] reductase
MHIVNLAPASFQAASEAYGRPVSLLDLSNGSAALRAYGLVFDATGIQEPGDLSALYTFFHPLLPGLEPNGRVVVLGRPPQETTNHVAATTQAALEGFVRSVAKEIGRKGATAQLLSVRAGAEPLIAPVLRFILSERSAFITGQPLEIRPVEGSEKPSFERSLKGKVALVTGAARGIGEATARSLAAEGAHVVCLDRPSAAEAAARVAQIVSGKELLLDLADSATPDAIARYFRERHDGVDIIVHNAGITRDKTLARMSREHWDQVLNVNLSAILRIDDALANGILRDQGRVVYLSSIGGIAGNVGQTNYAAAKAGLIGYVRKRAELLAPHAITANAVAPGFIETRMTAAIPLMIREAGRRLSALGQGGQPRDVAEAITFLATPGAAGVTGQVLRVCGGAFIGA